MWVVDWKAKEEGGVGRRDGGLEVGKKKKTEDPGGAGWCFFFQAEDGIRYLVRSRGLGGVYKRQPFARAKPRPRRAAGRGKQGSGLLLSLIHT